MTIDDIPTDPNKRGSWLIWAGPRFDTKTKDPTRRGFATAIEFARYCSHDNLPAAIAEATALGYPAFMIAEVTDPVFVATLMHPGVVRCASDPSSAKLAETTARVRSMLRVFGLSGFQITQWIGQRQESLEGDTPAEAIAAGRGEDVFRAAREMAKAEGFV